MNYDCDDEQDVVDFIGQHESLNSMNINHI
jgi:hypothetical protein